MLQNDTIFAFDYKPSRNLSKMKEALGKSMPELEENAETLLNAATEHFNRHFDENLNNEISIGMSDEDEFITASENTNGVDPS